MAALKQPMIEKLVILHFLGAVEASQMHERDAATRADLLGGPGLLLDQQSSWRENQALWTQVEDWSGRGDFNA
jgi:hypothetical protein